MLKQIIIIVILCCSSLLVFSQKTFMPGEIWPDSDGHHINAHGSGVLFHEGKYYMFGEHKGGGALAEFGVRCYSSVNLINWDNEGIALSVEPEGSNSDIEKGCILERPKVVYNKSTQKFVMWFHLELKGRGYDAAHAGVAIADVVTGPYTFLHSLRPNAGVWPLNFTQTQKNKHFDYNMDRWSDDGQKAVEEGMYCQRDYEGGQMSRDMALFVDDDMKAYHIGSSEDNATLQIRELTEDYTLFTGKYVRVFPNGHNEAPAIFKRKGKYYMFASGCTGWDPNPGRSAVANHIMGPWFYLGNFALGDEQQQKTTFRSQSTCVIKVQGYDDAYIYCGDRWNKRNLSDSRYIWLPISWDNDRPTVRWHESWSVDIFKQ